MMSVSDYLICLAGLVITVSAFFRGFLKEIFSLLYVFFLIFFMPKLLPALSTYQTMFPNYFAFAGTAVFLTWICFQIPAFLLPKLHLYKKGSITDRFAGFFTGCAKFSAILLLLCGLLKLGIPPFTMLEKSQIINKITVLTENHIDYQKWTDEVFSLFQNNLSAVLVQSGDTEETETDQTTKITTVMELSKQISSSEKLKSLLSDPDISEKLSSGRITELLQDKKIADTLKDPEIAKEFSRILKNADLPALLKDVNQLKKESSQ